MRSIRSMIVVAALAVAFSASAQSPVQQQPKGVQPKQEVAPAQKQATKDDSCEHGVKKTLCTRCNPKLAAVFKAKGDWCAEHERPESQCVICNPELAKKGVK